MWIKAYLEAALNKEKEKYARCPVIPDLVPGYDDAQAWGYVVAGYSLLEQGLKAVLHVRGEDVPRRHSLANLFGLLDEADQEILREFYADFRATIGGATGKFPYGSLDEFVVNLDGDANERGEPVGSFDWRYFPIEERHSQRMPLVSVDYLHELVYGCVRILECDDHAKSDPLGSCRSRRLLWERAQKYDSWLIVRMNTDGWKNIGDRWEILWGPDYRARYDLFCFREGTLVSFFSELPDDDGLAVIDKRDEVKAFDPERGLESVGIMMVKPFRGTGYE